MSLEVYHGSNMVVEKPIIMPYIRPLDFGAGFYITTYYSQAKVWAEKKAKRHGNQAIVNKYRLDLTGLNVKEFKDAGEPWIDFVVLNRKTKENIKHHYDIIIGEVADDQVFDSIQLYIDNIYDKQRLLQELKTKIENNQLCLATQKSLNQLTFEGVEYL